MFCKVSWQDCGVYEKMRELRVKNEELRVESGELIKYKIVRKPIKHLYMEVKNGYVEIRCNKFVSKKFIEEFILKHKETILKKLQKKYFYLGREVEKEVDYKNVTPKIVLPLVEKYSEIMKLYPSKISFRFNKSRWGSCSYKNSIVFNYYLSKLPIELIEYVVVHELAHIKHKHHQKPFWNEVAKILPDVKIRRKSLRKYEKMF